MKTREAVIKYFKRKQKAYHHTERGHCELTEFERLLETFEADVVAKTKKQCLAALRKI